MNYNKSKSNKIFEGKGFYLIIALCLIAIGVAAWMALARMDEEPLPDVPNTMENTSSTESVTETPSEPEPPIEGAGTDASEPYEAPVVSEPPTTTPPPVANTFTMPINGNVLKHFSDDELIYSNTYRDMRVHLGIDIVGQSKAPVRSCGSGIVVAIIEDAKLGRYVEIDHGRGIVARYCGLGEVFVEEGDTVDATVKIGTLGEVPEESVDANHLHLEFYDNEKTVDPLSVIYPET